MGLTADGTPVMQFLDAKGEPEWTAPSSFSPSIDITDEPPKPSGPKARERG
jgi:hypothetical protein